MLPSQKAFQSSLAYADNTTKEHKKSNGQFFTPLEVARFIAALSKTTPQEPVVVCDPGCGTGILTCSLVEQLIENGIKAIRADVFETDVNIYEYLKCNLDSLIGYADNKGATFTYTILQENFLEYTAKNLEALEERYDIVISNPPYFKLRKDDTNIKSTDRFLKGVTNIYSGFIAASIKICKTSGECLFIVPRSFTSGLYFKSLRHFIFKETRIKRIHLFESRKKTFKADNVLQETIIFRTSNQEGTSTEITVSDGIDDLHQATSHHYQIEDIIELNSEDKVLHLPTNEDEYELIQKMKSLKFNLADHNIKVSTGRIVAFRMKDYLSNDAAPENVPLIWGDNIVPHGVVWPLNQSKKEQYVNTAIGNLIVPIGNYVVQRRFSAKEDKRRLICAPISISSFDYEYLGFENKTNFFYRVGKPFTLAEINGLSLLLNSTLYDRYFRLINGNINVSATEMRIMPLPALSLIRELGNRFMANNLEITIADSLINEVVFSSKSELVTV